jgi:hypothetical protein
LAPKQRHSGPHRLKFSALFRGQPARHVISLSQNIELGRPELMQPQLLAVTLVANVGRRTENWGLDWGQLVALSKGQRLRLPMSHMLARVHNGSSMQPPDLSTCRRVLQRSVSESQLRPVWPSLLMIVDEAYATEPCFRRHIPSSNAHVLE